jgi:hypothetical protein
VKRFTVHHYLPVLVTVVEVEAESAEAAMEQSLGDAMAFANYQFTSDVRNRGSIRSTQFADGQLGALVDVEGDDEYLETKFIGSSEARCYLPEDLELRLSRESKEPADGKSP